MHGLLKFAYEAHPNNVVYSSSSILVSIIPVSVIMSDLQAPSIKGCLQL